MKAQGRRVPRPHICTESVVELSTYARSSYSRRVWPDIAIRRSRRGGKIGWLLIVGPDVNSCPQGCLQNKLEPFS